MPINFPNSPATNDTYSYDNKSWMWSGSYWSSLGSTNFVVGSTGATGSQGITGATGLVGNYVSSVTGTTGEIEVSGSTGAVVIGLPNNVIITGSLTIGGITLSASGGNITINGGIEVLGNINSTGILSVDGLIITKTGFSGYTGDADLETLESVLLDGGEY